MRSAVHAGCLTVFSFDSSSWFIANIIRTGNRSLDRSLKFLLHVVKFISYYLCYEENLELFSFSVSREHAGNSEYKHQSGWIGSDYTEPKLL